MSYGQGRSYMQQQVLAVLGIEEEPYSGLGGPFWGMQHARGDYIDYLIVTEVLGLDGASTRYLANQIGVSGTRIAGRLNSLRARGIVQEVYGRAAAATIELERECWDGGWVSGSGRVFKLTAAAERRGYPSPGTPRR